MQISCQDQGHTVTFHLLLSTADMRCEWLYAGLAAVVGTYLLYTGTRAA